jgi:hypothetical protein
MTDDERAREVVGLIVEALRLSDTRRLAIVRYLLGIVAIEAAREAGVSVDQTLPPDVVPLRWPRPSSEKSGNS